MEGVQELRGPLDLIPPLEATAGEEGDLGGRRDLRGTDGAASSVLGGAFGASGSWVYRYNEACLEVWSARDQPARNTHVGRSATTTASTAVSGVSGPFAVLHAAHLSECDLQVFACVTAATIGSRTCFFVSTHTISSKPKLYWWDPLVMKYAPVDMQLPGAVSCLAVAGPFVANSLVRQHYMLLVGSTDGNVHAARILIPTSPFYEGDTPDNFTWEYAGKIRCPKFGVITSIAAYTPLDGDYDHEPTIAVGCSKGKLGLFYFDSAGDGFLKHVMSLDREGTGGAVVKLIFWPVGDSRLERSESVVPLLFVAWGTPPGSRNSSAPKVRVFQLDLPDGRPSYNLLYESQAEEAIVPPDGSLAGLENYTTEAMVVSKFGDGLQLCFVFRARFVNAETKVQLVSVKMDGLVLREIEHQDIPMNWSDMILDIGVFKDSMEVDFLFASKKAVYTGFLASDEDLDGQAEEQCCVPDLADLLGDGNRAPYSPITIGRIREKRELLGGRLLYDELLQLVGIADSNISNYYPPRDSQMMRDMEELIDIIYKATNLNLLERHCLVYYLLKDWGVDTSQFASKFGIPRHYRTAMDGYWDVDHEQWVDAVRKLADPAVILNWEFTILRLIHTRSRSPLPAYLFFHLAHPLLLSSDKPQNLTLENLQLVLDVLVRKDLTEAFIFARKYDELGSFEQGYQSKFLLERLLVWCFSEPFPDKRKAISQLLAFPLNSSEEQFLAAHCSTPGAPKVAKDFLLVYYVHRGLYQRAYVFYKTDPAFAAKNNRALEAIVQNLSRSLPAPQWRIIEQELKRHVVPPPVVRPADETASHVHRVPSPQRAASVRESRATPCPGPETTPLRRSTRTRYERTILTVDFEGKYVESVPSDRISRSSSSISISSMGAASSGAKPSRAMSAGMPISAAVAALLTGPTSTRRGSKKAVSLTNSAVSSAASSARSSVEPEIHSDNPASSADSPAARGRRARKSGGTLPPRRIVTRKMAACLEEALQEENT